MARKVFISAMLFCLIVPAIVNAADEAEDYGTVVVTSVADVGSDYSFVCDINDWPAVVGKSITVKIDSVVKPKADTNNPHQAELDDRIKDCLRTSLADCNVIVLRNIKRGKSFSIIADVEVDGRNLSEILVEKGFAKVGKEVEVEEPSQAENVVAEKTAGKAAESGAIYIASKNSRVFHREGCIMAKKINSQNKIIFNSREDATKSGRRPCRECNP